jgi:hypothetical protein
VSPSFSLRYAARTMRRITFAFRVFWYVIYKNHCAGCKRFAKLGGEHVF